MPQYRSTKDIESDIQKVTEFQASNRLKLEKLRNDEAGIKDAAGDAILSGRIYDINLALDKLHNDQAVTALGLDAAARKMMELESELSNSRSAENRAEWERIEPVIWKRVQEITGVFEDLKARSKALIADLPQWSPQAQKASQDASIRLSRISLVVSHIVKDMTALESEIAGMKAFKD